MKVRRDGTPEVTVLPGTSGGCPAVNLVRYPTTNLAGDPAGFPDVNSAHYKKNKYRILQIKS